MKIRFDPALLALIVLLSLTLTGFLLGVLPYPVGIIVLIVFIFVRIQQLQQHK